MSPPEPSLSPFLTLGNLVPGLRQFLLEIETGSLSNRGMKVVRLPSAELASTTTVDLIARNRSDGMPVVVIEFTALVFRAEVLPLGSGVEWTVAQKLTPAYSGLIKSRDLVLPGHVLLLTSAVTGAKKDMLASVVLSMLPCASTCPCNCPRVR